MGLRETIRTSFPKCFSRLWGQPDWIAITASLAAFLVYLNTLKAGFVYDDSRAILTNPDIRPETPWSNLLQNDFWGTPLQNSGSHKSYRPLTTLSFRLNFLLSGLNPWPYHLTNVLLHTLTTWLFVHVARLVFCSKSCLYLNTLCHTSNGPSSSSTSSTTKSCQRRGRFLEVTNSRNLAVLLSSLLFALHPIHTEAVAGLVGRADVGSTAFALLSFLCYVKCVKCRSKARIFSNVITTSRNNYYYLQQQHASSSSNNSSRSHSPLCPNKNKKAVNNLYHHNHYYQHQHRHHHSQQFQHENQQQQSSFKMMTGLSSLFTRFTTILTCFSSFLLLRMKMFVVNQEDEEGGKSGSVTTTKGSGDNVTTSPTAPGINGGRYQKVKGSASDSGNALGCDGSCRALGGDSASIDVLRGGSSVICVFWLRFAAWFIATLVFAAAAMLTKEQGITILLVCATYDLVRSLLRTTHLYQERPSLLRLECGWSLVLLGLSSISLLFFRLSLMGPTFVPPVFSKADNSIAHQSSFWIRLGTFLFLPVFNFGLIIFPNPLSYDWSMDAIPPIQSFWELRNLISLGFYGILVRSVYLLVRKLVQRSQEVTANDAPIPNSFSTPKRASANNVRSRRDFLSLNGHSSHNGISSGNGTISGNFSSQWWPWSTTWSTCSFPSNSSSSSSITPGGSSECALSPSVPPADDLSSAASTYPGCSVGNGPNRKDYCNVCHLWMSLGRKQSQQHQHNNNNSIWNDDDGSRSSPAPPSSSEYLPFFGGNQPEKDCDDTSSNGSSCSSRSSSSSSSSCSTSHTPPYNSLISNGHQGRSNHYRSSGNSLPLPPAHHHHQNLRYRVTSSNSSNICNGFENGTGNSSNGTSNTPFLPTFAHSPAGNNGIINTTTNNRKSFTPTFPSSAVEAEESLVESAALSRSSEGSAALVCASLLVQLSLLVLPFLPATNLFFYVGFVVAERVLYMPSVGFSLLLGHGFLHIWNRLQCHHHAPATTTHFQHQKYHHYHHHHHHHHRQRHHNNNSRGGQGHHHHSRYNSNASKSAASPGSSSFSKNMSAMIPPASKRQKRLRTLFVAVVITSLLVLSLRTLRRNEDWEDEGKLYKAGIQVNPPKSWGNLGIVLSNQGKSKEAEQAYRKALHFRSNLADVHYNLGILLEGQGRLDEALESYRSAIHFRPKLAPAYVNAGQVLTRLGRIGDAREMYTTCLAISDEGIKDLRNHLEAKTSAYLRLGKLLVEDEDDPRAAVGIYRQAVKLMPSDYSQKQAVYNSLGEALYRNGQPEEAEQWFIKALRTKPDHVPAHLTYGKMLARNKTRLLEAESWFRRAKKIAPADSSVYHHYGQFLSVQGRHSEAAESYVTAANLAPNDYDIIVGAANALRLSGDNNQAELYYKKAVALRPQEARAHMNYGAILHVNGKYTEATKSYLTALRLKPEDDVTLMNLKKVMAISKSSKSLVLISCQHNKDLL